MILRKVTLNHWRALEKFEMVLEVGINVLQGRNEAGKSSVVEAIDWGLYRDITGARVPTAEIRSIIPASDPTARPSVEIELEFPDCRVTLLKILAEDSAKRECRLTLRRDGQADEYFDRTDAQKRLRALLSADGMGEEKGGAATGGLLVSHQGESIDFLSDGTAAIRSTLGIGSDGQLALTARLERARASIETLRRREILQELESSAIEVARAGTAAALARDELKEARFQLAHFEGIVEKIEDLRDALDSIALKIEEVGPRQLAAQAELEKLGATLLAQTEADKVVLSSQQHEREARVALENAKTRTSEIARLRSLQEAAQRDIAGSEEAVEAARLALEVAQKASDEAQKAQEFAGMEAESTRHLADAWRHYEAVFIAQTALREERKALESLQALGATLTEAQKQRESAPKAPSPESIREWRAAYESLVRLETEAAQGVQFEVRLESPSEAAWSSDGADAQVAKLEKEKVGHFAAFAEGVLQIEGMGQFRVRTGARGVAELKADVQAARDSLQAAIAPWEATITHLPEAFSRFESTRSIADQLETAWKEAAEALRREESRLGSLNDAAKRVSEKEAEFQSARKNCEAFEGVIELGGKGRREVKAALEAADLEAREASSKANKARNEAATVSQQLRQAESKFHEIKAKPDALRAAIAGRAHELERLEGDGLSPEAREEQLEKLNQTLARFQLELSKVSEARRSMGNSITQWRLSEARRLAGELSAEREALEKEQVALQRDLYNACQQDAGAEIERLTVKVEELDGITNRHEARLRGVLLLDAVLQAERARLSRDLAGPLNEKLGPWLSSLRGKETSLAFDESGSRIENILSRSGDSTISLPFAEHSEGLKEQVAFALRLLLATRVASHLPSKRLPLVLDDPFTQSDASRTGGLGDVLKDAALSLQILFVTCHAAPQVDGLALNMILLGEWTGGPDAKSKSPLKSKRNGRMTSDKIEAPEQTLALF